MEDLNDEMEDACGVDSSLDKQADATTCYSALKWGILIDDYLLRKCYHLLKRYSIISVMH